MTFPETGAPPQLSANGQSILTEKHQLFVSKRKNEKRGDLQSRFFTLQPLPTSRRRRRCHDRRLQSRLATDVKRGRRTISNYRVMRRRKREISNLLFYVGGFLEGIRGIAILAVICFHFYPQYFPNGYLGVDQFFVLSGFLMTLIFGSKPINKDSIFMFYYRRVKRIVPLYAFVILFVLLFIIFFMQPAFIKLNFPSALRATTFTTNLILPSEEEDDENYLAKLDTAKDSFTHTWSLSVELQFYLFVPLLFGIYQLFCAFNWQILGHVFFGLLAIFSVACHVFAPEAISFNSTLARFWQFYIGIEAFFITQFLNCRKTNLNDIEANGNKLALKEVATANQLPAKIDVPVDADNRSNTEKFAHIFIYAIFLIANLAISFMPFTLPPIQFRLASTLSTGLVIIYSSYHEKRNVLSNSILILMGDISYALYLIHWPILVWIKYKYEESEYAPLFGIAISIGLAYVIFRNYETWYLTLNKLSISLLIAILYALILTIALNPEYFRKLSQTHLSAAIKNKENDVFFKTTDTSQFDAITVNQAWEKLEYKGMIIDNCSPKAMKIQMRHLCAFKLPKPNNWKRKYKMMTIGNSYARTFAPAIYEEFGKYAKEMIQYHCPYCEVLANDPSRSDCPEKYQNTLKLVANMKPDFLFIIAKSQPNTLDSPLEENINSIMDDKIFAETYETVQKYENITKRRIFIAQTIPVPVKGFLSKLVKKQQNNETVISADYIDPDHKYMNGIKRYKELAKRCKKCTILPFGELFFADNDYTKPQFYDPKTKLSYFFPLQHITAPGIELTRPILKIAASQIAAGKYH